MGTIDVRAKPNAVFKFFTRIPSYLIRLGMTRPFEANILVLSTRGRKTGTTLRTPVGFARKDDIIYLAAVYKDPDWFQNALEDPEVKVQIGKRHLKGYASGVDDLEEKAEAYRAIVKAQGEKSAEQYYYVKPGMDDNQIGSIGEGLPMMRI
ncbi:MAG: nitroreductase/quinone reductase family protein, partial [Candidatus Undinarchaeales archaeon]|nr:nitroreductase/quinone reductase family protein [Candidatus Undinarchaeales archaeon]